MFVSSNTAYAPSRSVDLVSDFKYYLVSIALQAAHIIHLCWLYLEDFSIPSVHRLPKDYKPIIEEFGALESELVTTTSLVGVLANIFKEQQQQLQSDEISVITSTQRQPMHSCLGALAEKHISRQQD